MKNYMRKEKQSKALCNPYIKICGMFYVYLHKCFAKALLCRDITT